MSGSYPNKLKVATSLAGVNRAGTLLVRPTIPSLATRSMLGMRAACRGVLPPSDSCASSAQPSGITIAYFMRCSDATNFAWMRYYNYPHPDVPGCWNEEIIVEIGGVAGKCAGSRGDILRRGAGAEERLQQGD